MSAYVDKVKKAVEKEGGDYEVFYQSVIGLGIDDLNKNILTYQKHLQETMAAMKIHPEILKVEALVKKYEKPYRDKIKACKDKIKSLKKLVDDSICVPDLEAQMVIQTSNAENEKIKMSMDVQVIDTKKELNELKGPFNDAKKALDIKIAYLNILVQELKGNDFED